MNIGIIGSGSVGKSLARGFATNKHSVLLGTRDPEKPELREWAAPLHIELGSISQAAAFGDVVVFATPWSNGATENAIRLANPDTLTDKIVIDTTNPLGLVDGKLQLTLGWSTSGGEMVQTWLPRAHVVKAFNTVGAESMTAAQRVDGTPDLFIAGDDVHAKQVVSELAREFGWQVIDAGGIDKARLLEPLALLWVDYARTHKTRSHVFKLLKE